MAISVKLAHALALKAVCDEIEDLGTKAEIEAEFQVHKAASESAIAYHQAARDVKLAALAAAQARCAQVSADTGVEVDDIVSVDISKSEVTLKQI